MDNNFQDYIDPVVSDCKYVNCSDFQCDNVNKVSIMHVNSRSLFKVELQRKLQLCTNYILCLC